MGAAAACASASSTRSCVAELDIPRFAEIGVTASVQFSHATADRDLADDAWAGMTDRAYAYRSLLDAGARLANGSDAPVEELDPLAGLRAGVQRTHRRPPGRGTPSSASRSTPPAGDLHRPGLAGRRRGPPRPLAPGMLADLVVLDRDPYEDLEGAQVVATMSAAAGPTVRCMNESYVARGEPARRVRAGGRRAAAGRGRRAALVALSGWLAGTTVDGLARVLRLTHSGAVRLADRLERDGLVERRPGRTGARARCT